ncbi:MAG: ferritin [Candidatus Krumholzibacteriota bacterium]|nr:ferritin [Candidatus Krumholzibacteriota bacterium]
MLDPKMEKALNKQVNAELFAFYLYLSIATWMEDKGLLGMGTWMRSQAEEEVSHAMRLYGFVQERGGRVTLAAIDAPATEWKSAQDAFTAALAHEVKVTGMINGLVDLAHEIKDHAAAVFLQWFVSEQVEEEAQVQEILDKFKLAGDHPGFLYMLDKELGSRPASFITPPLEA